MKFWRLGKFYRNFRSSGPSSRAIGTKSLLKVNHKLLLALAGGVLCFENRKKFLESCGIIGYVGERPIATEVLLEGLQQMQNRGYDSTGVATFKDSDVVVTKYASDPVKVSDSLKKLSADVPQKHKESKIGIGHTRWATHGAKTDVNAHPHSDYKNRVFVVHNGTISNTKDIYQILSEKNIPIKSETDTELIAQLVGIYLDEGYPLEKAVSAALEQLTGTWGLVIMEKENPQSLVVARKGSPMLIGIGDDGYYVGSEAAAFSKFTSRYIQLKDGEIMTLSPKKSLGEGRVEVIHKDQGHVSKGDYPHWTIKEIIEQPEAIARALNHGARLTQDSAKLGGLDEIKEKFLGVENLVLLGCGTSEFASLFGSHILKHLRILNTVQVIDGSEMTEYDIPKQNPGVIAISQSGETRDIVNPCQMLLERDVPVLSVVNVVGSQLARLTQHGVYMNAGREVAVASTKCFMNSCVVLTQIALWLSANLKPQDSDRRKDIVNSLLRLPMQVGSVIEMTKKEIEGLAQELKDEEHIFVLGRGLGESIAKEGALKIKEVTGVHAEGYQGGALKHGPFALIRKGTPIILIILNDENTELMNTALEEVMSREAKTIVITPDSSLVTSRTRPHKIIEVEENGMLTALLSVVPLQLMAYYLSIARGMNPDQPPNLAKVVTVS
mmetsp:Transcript_1177/g.1890  ORF Transcript_1177/g.1890 Transcript_1177/m.1890 type:complete len:667 (+) Transcript_1177:19-2019(+)